VFRVQFNCWLPRRDFLTVVDNRNSSVIFHGLNGNGSETFHDQNGNSVVMSQEDLNRNSSDMFYDLKGKSFFVCSITPSGILLVPWR
jgi:hypothetical protein